MRIKKLNPHVPTPQYAHEGDAGLDLCADIVQDRVTLRPGEKRVFNTGIACEIPPHNAGLLFPRSGLGTKFDIVLANTVGVIDSRYRDEIKVVLVNRGDEPVTINKHDRIAQLVIVPFLSVGIEVVDELSTTTRGAGFGSSGR